MAGEKGTFDGYMWLKTQATASGKEQLADECFREMCGWADKGLDDWPTNAQADEGGTQKAAWALMLQARAAAADVAVGAVVVRGRGRPKGPACGALKVKATDPPPSDLGRRIKVRKVHVPQVDE